MTDATQQRAAAAFRGWLADGLLASHIGNVQALANELRVPAQTVVDLWHDVATVAVLGSRVAYALHSYLSLHGWYFVTVAGGLGAKASLARPDLGEIIDGLVGEWEATEEHGCLSSLRPEAIRRLLRLAIKGALAQVRLSVLCDSVPDDEPTPDRGRGKGN